MAGEGSADKRDRENRSLNPAQTQKRRRDEACEALDAFETPVVFSRRKKRMVDAPIDGDRASAGTPHDSWLSLSVAKSTPPTLAPSLQTVARRLTPAVIGRNPFAVLAKERPSSSLPPGFFNIGNSCYLASVVQCLLGVGPFVGEIVRLAAAGRGGPVTRALCDVLEEIKGRKGETLRLDGLKAALAASKQGALFAGYRQRDAHEAFLKILEALQVEHGGSYRCPFSHGVEIKFECEACGHTARIEEHGHLNVTLGVGASAASGGGGVLRALGRTTERITKDCERCGGKHHRRTSLVTRMPRLLVVQMMRFEFSAGVVKKVDDEFAVEKTVNIAPDGSKKFELRGVVHHHGQYGHCGHYDAQVMRGSLWYRMNDATVSPKTDADVLRPSRTAYLIFYELV